MSALENKTSFKMSQYNKARGFAGPLNLRGFTLVEILVSIAILATLAAGVFLAINPKAQLNKASDATIQQDLRAIKTALDLFYQDTNCYPSQDEFAAILNSGKWVVGNTVYMQKVPKDPGGTPYIYITDGTVCPQWNTLFAQQSKDLPIDGTTGTTAICALPQSGSSKCVPNGFNSRWGCMTSGITKCATILAVNLPGVTGTPTPTGPGGGTPTPTPTLTPSGETYYVTLPPGSLPQFFQATIDPLFQAKGKTQTISTDIDGAPGNVSTVSATIKTDNQTQSVVLQKTATGVDSTTWSTSWTLNDTTRRTYVVSFKGETTGGDKSNFSIAVR